MLRVPSTLVRHCRSLWPDHRLTSPATWKTASTSSGIARSSEALSSIVPSTRPTGYCFSCVSLELGRCSATTAQPDRVSCSTRLRPTKPVPPVTKAVLLGTIYAFLFRRGRTKPSPLPPAARRRLVRMNGSVLRPVYGQRRLSRPVAARDHLSRQQRRRPSRGRAQATRSRMPACTVVTGLSHFAPRTERRVRGQPERLGRRQDVSGQRPHVSGRPLPERRRPPGSAL